MDSFFKERDGISAPKQRGDRMKISSKDSSAFNVESTGKLFKINDEAKGRCIKFLQMLSKHTKWELKEDNWNFSEFNKMQFTKSDFVGRKWTITKKNYKEFIELNPLSWAMTSGLNIEFTIEEPDKLI